MHPSRIHWKAVLRRSLIAAVLVAFIALCTVGGMAAGLLVGSPDRQHTSFGTVETSVVPDADGHVSVYVPLVDWRVHMLEYSAPIRIEIELLGVDRKRAGQGISSATAAQRSIDEVRADGEKVIHEAVQRAVAAAVIGGLVGALVAGALITSTRLRRRWLLIAPMIGLVVIAGAVAASIASMRDIEARDVHVTAAGGHADELPVVLRFAEQLLDVGDEYEGHYRTALESITNVARFAANGDEPAPDSTALVISDFHDNVFVLDALDQFAGDSTVFAVGDFVLVGARIEQRTAAKIAKLGDRVIAVSGNHDTPEYMHSLAEEGVDVLDHDTPTTSFDKLLVAGYPDPLERPLNSHGEHQLRVYGKEYEAQVQDVLSWWDHLPERPDVVLIHQHGFAHRLLEHVRASGDTQRLVILTGHDHKAHVHRYGKQVIVDAGTVGAGGIAAVGKQSASFAQLELTNGEITAVRTISVEPLTGKATTKRIDLHED